MAVQAPINRIKFGVNGLRTELNRIIAVGGKPGKLILSISISISSCIIQLITVIIKKQNRIRNLFCGFYKNKNKK